MKKRIVMAMIASMAFAATASGAEMEYSGTLCGIQKRNVLYSTPDLTVLSLQCCLSSLAVSNRQRARSRLGRMRVSTAWATLALRKESLAA